MRTKLLAFASVVVVSLVFLAYSGNAQEIPEPAPDLGTADVRVSACHFASSVALAEGLKVTWCRAGTREEVTYLHGGVVAIVPLTIKAEGVKYKLAVHMNKSLWSGSALSIQ